VTPAGYITPDVYMREASPQGSILRALDALIRDTTHRDLLPQAEVMDALLDLRLIVVDSWSRGGPAAGGGTDAAGGGSEDPRLGGRATTGPGGEAATSRLEKLYPPPAPPPRLRDRDQ
jgi:hypothetical protein